MLETGIRGEAKEVVSESNSAQAMKSGELKEYATPSMIALMEQVFKVEAFDERGMIGEGTHERFVIDNEKFQEKANNK